MHAFEYDAPTTLQDAIDMLARDPASSRPLAGGTDLIDQMRMGRYRPAHVIDVKKINELNVLEVTDQGLRLGAAVPCRRILAEPQIVEHYAALADSCRILGGIQIQSRASVGGNLCNSGPAADSTPSLIALQATCVIAGADGQREVPVESFCMGPGKNVLAPGELLVELRFPPVSGAFGSHYRRLIPRNEMDIAVVGVGAAVQLDDSKTHFTSARIALAAVAPTPLLAKEASEALAGEPINDEVIQRAAEACGSIVQPIDDMRGTVAYRRHVSSVLVKRVLQAAVQRARGESLDYHPGH